jgi:hypothetical protein
MTESLKQGIMLKSNKYKYNYKPAINSIENSTVHTYNSSVNILKNTFNPLLKIKPNIFENYENSNGNGNENGNVNIESIESEVKDLQVQFNSLLDQVNIAKMQLNDSYKQYGESIDGAKNPYLNKNIHFSDPEAGGSIGYVTNQAEIKWFGDGDIYHGSIGKNGCPTELVEADFPFSKELWKGGYTKSNPKLMIGTPMTKGQSCGNEGKNVFVDKLISNLKTTFKGCFGDNPEKRTMTFIGGGPVKNIGIQNGDFSQPQITENTYEVKQNIPSWTGNFVLMNNSSAWMYPLPYPSGNQAICFQKMTYIEQTIYVTASSKYKLSFYLCGRDCCDGSRISNPINIKLNDSIIQTITPPIRIWTNYNIEIDISKIGSNTITFQGTHNGSDRSTALANVSLSSTGNSSSGNYTYEDCQKEAINSGYKYFALQNVNIENSKGYCAVSNDAISPQQYGGAVVPNNVISIWSSNTSTNSANVATLINTGSLVVNVGEKSIFSTPNTAKQPSNYLGCFRDSSNRAMTLVNGGAQSFNYDTCNIFAKANNFKYFALQNSSSGNNAQCSVSNSEAISKKYGNATNCTMLKDGKYSGGGYSNALYNSEPDANYFLILQNDGNMCIYRGTGPNDNQGYIWCAFTQGKQKDSNSNFASEKGKYGKNYITNGQSLSSGDFIGSTNGSMYLIMQDDGNLVLYTSENVENCSILSNGNKVGGENANALYEMAEVGLPANMNKLGYVDGDGVLSEYPESNKNIVNNNNNSCSKTIVNIDSNQWENYKKSNVQMNPNTKCGMNKITIDQQKHIKDLNNQMEIVSTSMLDKINILENEYNKTNKNINNNDLESKKKIKEYKEYKIEIQKIIADNENKKIKEGYTNMNIIDNILEDSTIVERQSTFSYIMWCYLALVLILYTINVYTNGLYTNIFIKLISAITIIMLISILFKDYSLVVLLFFAFLMLIIKSSYII